MTGNTTIDVDGTADTGGVPLPPQHVLAKVWGRDTYGRGFSAR